MCKQCMPDLTISTCAETSGSLVYFVGGDIPKGVKELLADRHGIVGVSAHINETKLVSGCDDKKLSVPLASLLFALSVTFLLTSCKPAVMDPQGPIGHANRTILIDSLAIMLAIVIPTIIATIAFAWWYRASNRKARYLPDWEFSGQIEMIVWAIPTMTIVLLGGVTWIGAHELDPANPIASTTPAIEIQVVSLDWKWLFIYPEQGIATVNELVVPAGTPLHFSLTSASVMNSFFVPQLGSMIYTMNGMATELNLQADQPGTFRGISAHYSGEGFSDMHFNVRALSAEQYAHWVNDTRDAGPTLDENAYVALAKQSIAIPASTFASVDRDLFKRVLSQNLAAGPGPETDAYGATQKPEIKP